MNAYGRLRRSLGAGAAAILATSDPERKVSLTAQLERRWRGGDLRPGHGEAVKDRPARPDLPELRPPRDMPRRRSGGIAGRIALLHALAHIELNAIDLAWDLIARFGAELPRACLDDWVQVAAEEARHFAALSVRLRELGSHYGALPAHDGLWQAAEATRHDILARLAIVPLVLEARGLDVTPAMIAGLSRAGDAESAAILTMILTDEITHVAVGMRWFRYLCEARGTQPEITWQSLVRHHFKGQLKRPFNVSARLQAAFPASFYEPLATC